MTGGYMKAIKVVEAGKIELRKVALPTLRDDYVLCRVRYVALNPTDWKHIDFMPTRGATPGCDFSGVVEEVGCAVTKSWKKGDRIAGFLHGVNAVEVEDGTFAEYCMAKGDLQMKIPDNVSDEQACTLGVGITTVGQALYQSLKMPLPGSSKHVNTPVLIYGAGTATGSLAVQFAVMSGFEVVATCSASTFEKVTNLGATTVLDYKDPDCGPKIREKTQDRLMHALDCISDSGSSQVCCDAMSSGGGGTINYLLPLKHTRSDIVNNLTLAYTVMGERFFLDGTEYEPRPADFDFGKMFWNLATALLASGQIQTHPTVLGLGGLNGISGGLQKLRQNEIRGQKLIYKIARK